jgi:hypothetical protein
VLPSSVQPAPELAPFGVRVCASEPGGMRINWGKAGKLASSDVPKLFPEYEPSVGLIIKRLEDHGRMRISDPAKVAQVILPGLRRTSGNQTTRRGTISAFQPIWGM